MNKFTSKELDEQIDESWDYSALGKLTRGWNTEEMIELKLKFIEQQKQLIRDCIEAVTPKAQNLRDVAYEQGNGIATTQAQGFNQVIDTIEANTIELLGGKPDAK